MSRPRYGYLLFDFPSDHEIDGVLSTECEVIKAVLAKRNLGSRLKRCRCSSLASFMNLKLSQFKGVRFVHIGGHGSKEGLTFIGGSARWVDVASLLMQCLNPLQEGKKRVLTLSCCHSMQGMEILRKHLAGYFTGGYYFCQDSIDFSSAITVWSMFYLKKNLLHRNQKIVDSINAFMGTDVIGYYSFPE